MSYIGNQPTNVAFLTDTFNGTGSQTAFTMSVAPASTSSVLVAVTGVLQDPSTYSVSGTTLTFSAAPPAGTGNISVRYLGIPASGVTTTAYRTVTEFTATAGQTSFSVPSYTVGYVDVYRNGVMLGTADFTATTGTTVVLGVGATVGDLIRVESFYVSSVLNAIPATAGAVNSTYIATGAVGATQLATSGLSASALTTGTLPKAQLPAGTVLQVVQAVLTSDQATTSSSYVDVTGLSVAITPTSATSKVLVRVNLNNMSINDANLITFNLLRGATTLTYNTSGGVATTNQAWASGGGGGTNDNPRKISSCSLDYLDSPASTSSLTYKVQMRTTGGATGTINRWQLNTDNATVSSITLMEIAA